MKTIKILIPFVVFAVPWLWSPDVSAADVSVGVEVNSVNDFYEPLSAQGSWVEVGSYGRCWHPYYVDAGWRPYCEGTWVWTDDGWYWQSDEPWGWACYHYGRWTSDPYYGWVWVPDTEWGPSWVCFRQGGGYCGWAPLPPGWRGGVFVGVVPDNWFVFVGEHHFGERVHARTVIINNTTVINRTTIINKTRTTVNNRVMAEGPRVQDLQRGSHERIQTGNVQTLRQHEKAPAIIHRPVQQQPVIQRENEKPIERPGNEPAQRENPRGNPPEIIRGKPSAPEPPPVERQQRSEPPPVERREPQGEQRPSGPPAGEKVAPQHEKAPPPQEGGREEGGRDGGHDGQDKGH